MTSGHSRASILGATASVEYQAYLVFSLATSCLYIIGYLRQNWKCSAATGNPDFTSKTFRVLLVLAFISSMFSICRQQGKIRRSMKYLPTVEIFAKGLFSTPGLLQRTSLVYPILLKCKYSQIHWHNYQAIFFPNLNVSIKHRQIGGQSVRFALHKGFSIEVGCRFA